MSADYPVRREKRRLRAAVKSDHGRGVISVRPRGDPQSPMRVCMHARFVKRCTDIAMEKTGKAPDARTRSIIRPRCAIGMSRERLTRDSVTPAETAVEMMFNSMPGNLEGGSFE